jgi:hypothetical protein
MPGDFVQEEDINFWIIEEVYGYHFTGIQISDRL